jgi:hypothetical protein
MNTKPLSKAMTFWCALIALPCFLQAQPTPGGPAQRFEHHFGVVDAGTEIRHEFQVANDGAASLRLLGYRASCGACLSVQGMPNEIQAGHAATITLKLDTTAKQGSCLQRVIINTDDPKRPAILLSLSGIVKGIWTEPGHINFGTIAPGQCPEAHFNVLAAKLPDVKVLAVQSTAKHLRLTLGPPKNDHEIQPQGLDVITNIHVQWQGSHDQVGPFHTRITLTTSDPKYPTLQVPLDAYLIGDLEPRPVQIFFGAVDAGQTVHRTCTLIWHRQQNIPQPNEIAIQADHPYIQCGLSPSASNAHREMLLRVSLQSPQTPEIKLLTGNLVGTRNGQSLFSIPYTAYLAQSRPAANSTP